VADLAARLLTAMQLSPRGGLVAGELAILVDEYGRDLDVTLARLVESGEAFTTTCPFTGLTRFHPAGAEPMRYDAVLVRDVVEAGRA
jgi:hypothetical protein